MEKKKRRRFMSRVAAITLALCMVLGLAPFTEPVKVQAMTTQAAAVQWARNQVGSRYNEGFGVQCVALISKYCDYLGVPHIYGNAKDFTSSAIPSGWGRFEGVAVQPGDIAIWTGGYYATYGHVAIVLSANGSSFEVIDQNGGGNQEAGTIRTKAYGGGYWGVIRPNFNSDSTPPTISDIRVTDINSEGYTVTCRVEDAGGVAKVQFPTWTTYGDQDDVMADWGNNPSCRGTQNGTIWSYRVNVSDHNYEEGYYNTHIYAWDMAGNSSGAGVNDIYIDRTPPVISDVQVVDMDAAGYTVSCKVEDVSSGIAKVQFPTWTAANGQDDLAENWQDNPSCRGTQDGTIWSFRVDDKEHNFERGIYNTHIYAYDDNGNRTCYEVNDIVFQNTYSHVKEASFNGHTYYVYDDILTWDEAKARCEELRGHLVTITSADEQKTVEGLIQGQARRAYWIGGSSDNGSTWVSGEKYSFRNWELSEPNADDGADSYGIYTDKGTWNAWPGSNRHLGLGFICEWDEKKEEHVHNYKTIITPATTRANGSIIEKCSKCGDEKGKTVIYAVSKSVLPKTSYTYNGKTQMPSVAVKDSKGKVLENDTDYTISFPKGMKNVGRYTVIIILKGNYSGTISETFDIVPKGTSISKVTAKKKGFTVKWKKQKKQTTGYEIAYSTSSKFFPKPTKITDAGNSGVTSKTVLKLKAKKKYYVRIRIYKTVIINGKSSKLYSDWSKAKVVITKK